MLKTNLEAVKEIARQIRLRNLGGIIVLDLIDMNEHKNREKVYARRSRRRCGPTRRTRRSSRSRSSASSR